MSNAQELRSKAARMLRDGRKAKGEKKRELSKIYRTVAATYKNLAEEEEKMSRGNERSGQLKL
jgi:hypothetical protein